MKKLVVYSVLSDSDETFNSDIVKPGDEFDLVLLSNRSHIDSGKWHVRTFDTHSLDDVRASLRPKLMPHRYFQEYEWSLYIDANHMLDCNPREILLEYEEKGPSMFTFVDNNTCFYDLAEDIIEAGYEQERRVREQIDWYEKQGFPRGQGVLDGSMLLRRHHDTELKWLSEEWYEHTLRFAQQEQLSFSFVVWRRGYTYGLFGGESANNNYMHSLNLEREFESKQIENRPAAKRYKWRLRQIANKYKSDKGDIYYNAHNYADIYEFLLRRRRFEKLKILEIGLLRHSIQAKNPEGPYDSTPSLSMWREYLPNAEIHGFDIADFSIAPAIEGCTIHRGDMSSEADLDRLIEDTGGQFDIIIDDASHASHHQQIALAKLFPHLKVGGIYFIEDLHYQPPQMEIEGLLKTREIVKGLAVGSLHPTQFISRRTLADICRQASDIRFFDSGERIFGALLQDALVAIDKGEPKHSARFGRFFKGK